MSKRNVERSPDPQQVTIDGLARTVVAQQRTIDKLRAQGTVKPGTRELVIVLEDVSDADRPPDYRFVELENQDGASVGSFPIQPSSHTPFLEISIPYDRDDAWAQALAMAAIVAGQEHDTPFPADVVDAVLLEFGCRPKLPRKWPTRGELRDNPHLDPETRADVEASLERLDTVAQDDAGSTRELHVVLADNDASSPQMLFVELEDEKGASVGGFEHRREGQYTHVVIPVPYPVGPVRVKCSKGGTHSWPRNPTRDGTSCLKCGTTPAEAFALLRWLLPGTVAKRLD